MWDHPSVTSQPPPNNASMSKEPPDKLAKSAEQPWNWSLSLKYGAETLVSPSESVLSSCKRLKTQFQQIGTERNERRKQSNSFHGTLQTLEFSNCPEYLGVEGFVGRWPPGGVTLSSRPWSPPEQRGVFGLCFRLRAT